jgi:hypothetical protein
MIFDFLEIYDIARYENQMRTALFSNKFCY